MTNAIDELIDEVRRARELTTPPKARDIRRRAGVPQERFAAAMEVDRSTLSKWETGTSRPHPAQLHRWVQALQALSELTS